MLVQYVKRTERNAGALTVTSVMNGTGMLPTGGVEPGRPLKWNNRRLLLVPPTTLRARHAGLWRCIFGKSYDVCDVKVGKRRSCRELEGGSDAYRLSQGEHGRASV